MNTVGVAVSSALCTGTNATATAASRDHGLSGGHQLGVAAAAAGFGAALLAGAGNESNVQRVVAVLHVHQLRRVLLEEGLARARRLHHAGRRVVLQPELWIGVGKAVPRRLVALVGKAVVGELRLVHCFFLGRRFNQH